MNLRGSLFIKIFLGFWLVTLAVLSSWMFSNQYFLSRVDGDQLDRESRTQGQPHKFVMRVTYALQNTEKEKLPGLLRRAKQDHGVEIYVLYPDGHDLFKRPVPARIAQIANQLEGQRRRTARGQTPGELLLAHSIYRAEEGPLRAVFRFQPPNRPVLAFLAQNNWLRMVLAVLVSGLLCYFLSRLVTGRLQELSLASRRLAQGELGTRLLVRERGGDETDELARDFNVMAQQLQQRIQAQRRLLGDVSHELRSPLARLRVALALAQEQPSANPAQLVRIEREAERLEELIAQLLSTQAEQIELSDHIDIVALLRQLAADAKFEFKGQNKGVNLSCTVNEALTRTTGDLLRKSFENILRNALTHTARDTDVNLNLRRENDCYRISFADHGPGVPAEELTRIFDEFYRVDTARTRDTGGYGLGLAIARRAIEQHGGGLQALNTNQGLTVTVSLPIVDDT